MGNCERCKTNGCKNDHCNSMEELEAPHENCGGGCCKASPEGACHKWRDLGLPINQDQPELANNVIFEEKE